MISVISKNNSLLIDYSETLGYTYIIKISSWQKGISWGRYNKGINKHHEGYLDDPEIPFSIIFENDSTKEWVKTIPNYLIELLKKYEVTHKVSIYSLLWFLSRYQEAIDLFVNSPSLILIILHCAKRNNWKVDYVVNLILNKRVNILLACGLKGSKSSLRIIQNMTFYKFNNDEFLLLQRVLELPSYQWLNHLKYNDNALIKLVSLFPELLKTKLLSGYSKSWDVLRFQEVYEDTLRMTAILGNPSFAKSVGRCSSINDLLQLHNRFVLAVNQLGDNSMSDIDFPAPPLAGNEIIKPIISFKGLKTEGISMKHCVVSYHADILLGRTYIYRVLSPERATLEISQNCLGNYIISQLLLFDNMKPSSETKLVVMKWLSLQ